MLYGVSSWDACVWVVAVWCGSCVSVSSEGDDMTVEWGTRYVNTHGDVFLSPAEGEGYARGLVAGSPENTSLYRRYVGPWVEVEGVSDGQQ